MLEQVTEKAKGTSTLILSLSPNIQNATGNTLTTVKHKSVKTCTTRRPTNYVKSMENSTQITVLHISCTLSPVGPLLYPLETSISR